MRKVRTTPEVVEAVKVLRQFIGVSELNAMIEGLRGEEHTYFEGLFTRTAEIVKSMPVTYQQDGKGQAAIVSLHYFASGCDWYITEKDVDADGEGQVQAFGYADLGYGPEMGYISIKELLGCGAELDLHFKPRTVAEVEKLQVIAA